MPLRFLAFAVTPLEMLAVTDAASALRLSPQLGPCLHRAAGRGRPQGA
jgi:hypothetical protein